MPNYEQLVLEAKSPREAIIGLAVALDDLAARIEKLEANGGWDSWDTSDDTWQLAEEGDTVILAAAYADMEASEPTITETEDETIFEFPVPSEEKMEARRQFEREHLHIGECLGGDADPNVDYTEVYAKGGPLWLYHGNLDLFKSYSWPVKQVMCQDVIEDSPTQGRLMSLDALKLDGESGPGSVAMGSEASEIPQNKRWWNQ